MRRWVVPAGTTGGADALRLEQADVSAPGHGQVLVAMRAWSMNFRDLGMASSRYFGGAVGRDTAPRSDGAGEVAADGRAEGDGLTLPLDPLGGRSGEVFTGITASRSTCLTACNAAVIA